MITPSSNSKSLTPISHNSKTKMISPKAQENIEKNLKYTPTLKTQSPVKSPQGTPQKNQGNFSEFFTKAKTTTDYQLSEEMIKKNLLNSAGPDKDATLEAFKKYLKALIARKLTDSKKEKDDSKNINIDAEAKIRKKLEEQKNLNKKKSTIKKEDLDFKDLDPETQEIANAQKNYEKILMTSKKLKERMKIEKLDKAAKFYKQKIKQFSNLDTFINAKEFFEELNPFKENNGSKQTNIQYQAQKHLMTIKKLQKESNDFYDKRMKDFSDRMNELDKEVVVDVKEKNISPEGSNSDSDSSQSSVLSALIRNDRKNPKIMPLLKQNTTTTTTVLPGSKYNQINFSDNINFLEKQLGMNKSVVDFFKEFYDPKGLIKRTKQKSSELDKMRETVMRHLLVTDHTLNRLDCQLENNEDFMQLDGFYNQTLGVLNQEKNINKKNINIKKDDIELESLIRLEKLLETILKTNQKKKVKSQELDYLKKYVDYQEKSNKLLTLIDKTSRTIFQEKHKEIHDKVNLHLKSYKRRSMGNIMKKSGSVLIPGIYLTSIDHDLQDNSTSLMKLSQLPSVGRHFKSPSLTIPLIPNDKLDKLSSIKITSFQNDISEFSDRRRVRSIYERKWNNDLQQLNQNAHNYMPIIKKRTFRAISNIIEKTGRLQDNYEKDKEGLGEFETECDKFYKETKKKIDPPLESIISTLEKPNVNYRFTGFKKQAHMVRKHYT